MSSESIDFRHFSSNINELKNTAPILNTKSTDIKIKYYISNYENGNLLLKEIPIKGNKLSNSKAEKILSRLGSDDANLVTIEKSSGKKILKKRGSDEEIDFHHVKIISKSDSGHRKVKLIAREMFEIKNMTEQEYGEIRANVQQVLLSIINQSKKEEPEDSKDLDGRIQYLGKRDLNGSVKTHSKVPADIIEAGARGVVLNAQLSFTATQKSIHDERQAKKDEEAYETKTEAIKNDIRKHDTRKEEISRQDQKAAGIDNADHPKPAKKRRK